jgi:hypothetical protein
MKTITSPNIKALWCEKIKNNNQNKFERVNLRGNLGIWMRPSNLDSENKINKNHSRTQYSLSLSLTRRQNGLSFINKRGERFYPKKKKKKKRREREREESV